MQLENIQLINKGSTIARFDLHIPKWNITIRELMLFAKDSSRWVSMPSKSYEKDGKKKYYPFVTFKDAEIQKKFSEAVVKLFDEWHAKNGSISTQINQLPSQEEIPF